MPPNDPTPATPPQYEPGGGKLIAIAMTIVAVALAGMAWSFFSRQSAPKDAPAVKSRFLPPSERKEAPASQSGTAAPAAASPAAVPPASTPVPAK